MDVDKLLKNVIAQNEIIIKQNERLLRLLGEKKTSHEEMDQETAEHLTRIAKDFSS